MTLNFIHYYYFESVKILYWLNRHKYIGRFNRGERVRGKGKIEVSRGLFIGNPANRFEGQTRYLGAKNTFFSRSPFHLPGLPIKSPTCALVPLLAFTPPIPAALIPILTRPPTYSGKRRILFVLLCHGFLGTRR